MKDTRHLSVAQSETSNGCKNSAMKIRNCFKDFFTSPQSSVPWQNDYVNK